MLNETCRLSRDPHLTYYQVVCTAHTWNMLYNTLDSDRELGVLSY